MRYEQVVLRDNAVARIVCRTYFDSSQVFFVLDKRAGSMVMFDCIEDAEWLAERIEIDQDSGILVIAR